MACSNCFNCYLTKAGRVGCRRGHWETDKGEKFEYASMFSFLQNGGQDGKRSNPINCPNYEDLGPLDEKQTAIPLKQRYMQVKDILICRVYWMRIQGIKWRYIADKLGIHMRTAMGITKICPELIILKNQ